MENKVLTVKQEAALKLAPRFAAIARILKETYESPEYAVLFGKEYSRMNAMEDMAQKFVAMSEKYGR